MLQGCQLHIRLNELRSNKLSWKIKWVLLKVWLCENYINVLHEGRVVQGSLGPIMHKVAFLKKLHLLLRQINIHLAQHPSEFIILDDSLSQRIEVLEVLFRSDTVDLHLESDLIKQEFDLLEAFVVGAAPFTGVGIIRDVCEFREEVGLDVFDEVDVVDLAGFGSVHLGDGGEFFVGDVEVNCGEDLSELLGRNLIPCNLIRSQSIPILEELLHIKSCSLRESSEPRLHLLCDSYLFIRHLFS